MKNKLTTIILFLAAVGLIVFWWIWVFDKYPPIELEKPTEVKYEVEGEKQVELPAYNNEGKG